jgi:hypothetical protein
MTIDFKCVIKYILGLVNLIWKKFPWNEISYGIGGNLSSASREAWIGFRFPSVCV